FTRNDMNNWNFTSILIDQLIPYIEDHYSVSKDGAHRALGGLSMGGMQTINIGLPNADKFNYLMPSSSAPGIQGQSQLFGDGGTKAKANLKLILFTCGEREVGAYGCNNNNTVRGYCDNVGISDDIIFNWIAPGGAHDRVTWRPSFWNFVQMADQSGFTIGDVSVREYTAGHFSIAAMAGNVGVFDLRGKFLKNISAPEFSTRARDLSPGSYIIQWQSGSHSYTGKYAIGKGYNCIERQ
ncbi:MAG: hypothetical protein JW768_12190, partial [Chitinispirillaceae bacterium]|nr:hypothetical protein [Chitinispirillaceae bacterium]